LRVVVVGDCVFAAAIDSSRDERTALDSRQWHQADLTYYRVRLDDGERRRLVDLNRRLGLVYSSMDLIRTKDGSLYFLEANPSGQWGFIETLTGYPITEAIVDQLTRAR
jgi:glutathione synthase/RimK-type ligase-like ATP-grasp enzyme